MSDETFAALDNLTKHDLLVQLIRAREDQLMEVAEDWDSEGNRVTYKVINADALAYLIEEVIALADDRSRH